MDVTTHCYRMMWFPTWWQTSLRGFKVFSQKREEWVEVVVMCLNVHLGFKKGLSDFFKSQSSPWMKWCPPNYRVLKGNRLLCCPQPTTPGGLVPALQEEAWSSQSRSSRLWLVPYCRGRITRSCQSPAATQTDNEQENGNTRLKQLSLLFVCLKNIISLPVLSHLIHTLMSAGVFAWTFVWNWNVCTCGQCCHCLISMTRPSMSVCAILCMLDWVMLLNYV